ncbi:MAG: hypothetical protein EYC70_00760 [Planctomycetota bacterium]|nr:MAG: hypothetical protein EYC70_00760 [Planctomycetota bacterium]
MRRLLGALTPQVNRALEEPGVVVSGRYKALLVQTEQYLARLLAYVHSNPVRAGVTRGPWISTWTSAHAFLAGADDLVRVSRVAQLLDCSPLELPRLLDEERPNCMQRDEDLSGRELRREDLAECTGGAAPARRCHLSSPILGNEEFVARIHQRLDPAAAPIRVGASWYLLHRNEGLPEDLRADLERIRADHGLASWNLGRRKPPAQLTRARRAALEYARGRCSVSLSRAAEAVGMSPGAASRLLWRKRKFGRVFQPVFAVAAGVLPERVPTPLQGACDPHHSEVDTKTQAADP